MGQVASDTMSVAPSCAVARGTPAPVSIAPRSSGIAFSER